MKILTEAIVSNSDMIKNYKACLVKAESLGKIFVLKNNQPDAVLFSIQEYERLSTVIEYFENLEEVDINDLLNLCLEKQKERYLSSLRTDMI